VSHSLRSLEKELGCKLFQKRGNKLLIAPSGDVLLAFTRPWFEEMNSSETTKELIKAKMGVGILPDWFISREINAKELVALPLGAKRLIRPWGVSISEAKLLAREERTFIICLQKLGSRWVVNRNLS
jgi:DNA-binding transcriptional LysR family regulator